MTMLGSEEDRFDCVIDCQKEILEKIASIEKTTEIQDEKLSAYALEFKKQRKQEFDTYKKVEELRLVIDKIYYEQKVLLEERQTSIDFWKSMKDKLAGSGIVGFFVILGSVVWYALQQFIILGPKV